MKHLGSEHHFTGPVIERANQARWQAEGSSTVAQRARRQADDLVAAWQPPGLAPEVEAELIALMTAACRAHGADKLPERDS
jgi:trimethylamine:corrinoid methyltransferase-like protein